RHLPEDLRRVLPTRALHAPRHEMMMMVDGEAASALGDVFRDRWRRAGVADADLSTDVGVSPSPEDLWPSHVTPHVTNTKVAIARTLPAWRKQPVVDEIRRLTLDCIAHAREAIYLENQYFTSPLATEAIVARLVEPNGPEVVLITTGNSPSWFDRLTMDRARGAMLSRLRSADAFGRFRAFYPTTSDGQNIIVHSKCSIFDDRVVRIGSANLNNRSLGFDTECELGLECTSRTARKNLQAFRDELLAHYLGVGAGEVAGARAAHGSLAAAIDALNHSQRLRPIPTGPSSPLDRFLSTYHLGDPADVGDSWRLHRRHKQLTAEAQRVLGSR
ncbi:MAG: phospholipase D-like domain-containing protein, partial [Pseudomonadota bacterium]